MWEIDENNLTGDDLVPPAVGTPSTQRSRYTDDSSMHSRTTSVTSLLSSHSTSSSSKSRGFLSTLASKFSALSLRRNYQSGTAKGPDYKRVHVLSEQPDRRFKIDGGLLSPQDAEAHDSTGWSPPTTVPLSALAPAAAASAAPQPLTRDSTLPSVLDIRAPSHANGTGNSGSTSYGYGRSDAYVPDDETTEFMSPVVTQSDYSLRTSDLQTPVTPSRDAAAAAFSFSVGFVALAFIFTFVMLMEYGLFSSRGYSQGLPQARRSCPLRALSRRVPLP